MTLIAESQFLGDFPPTELPLTTTEASTISQTAAGPGPTPNSGVNLIGYVIGGFAGAVCILLIVVILVVVVLRCTISTRMKHNGDTQYYGKTHKLDNPSELIILLHTAKSSGLC